MVLEKSNLKKKYEKRKITINNGVGIQVWVINLTSAGNKGNVG